MQKIEGIGASYTLHKLLGLFWWSSERGIPLFRHCQVYYYKTSLKMQQDIHKAAGPDNVHAKVLREGVDIVSELLKITSSMTPVK